MDQDWGQVVKNEDIDVHVKIWDNVIESWENVFVFVLVVNNKIQRFGSFCCQEKG